MKTFMANVNNTPKNWLVVDAADVPLGRLATQVASLLRGKHKPAFTPHADCGDHVIVLNTDKVVLTGNKAVDKFHYTPSTRPGNLKSVQYKELLAERSDYMVWLAVKGMLPKSRLGRKQIKDLKLFKGETHEHHAQKPVAYAIVGRRR